MNKIKLPRIYHSGFRAVLKEHKNRSWEVELDFIRRSKIKYRCMSFAYIYPGAFYYQKKIEEMYKASIHEKVKVFIDSSAFSFYMMLRNQTGKLAKNKKTITDDEFMKLKDKVVDQYVEFINRDEKKIDFYANFDYVKNCKVIWEMQLELEKKGLRPAPVFHGDDSIDYFKRYCDKGYEIICIGGYGRRLTYLTRRRFFERIFRIADDYKVKLHAFAFGHVSNLLEFPWYSVDMSTWAKTAAYGMILVPDNDRQVLRSVHVSDRATNNQIAYARMPKSIQREIENEVAQNGFDFDLVRKSIYERCVYNAWIYSNLEKYIDLINKKSEWECFV